MCVFFLIRFSLIPILETCTKIDLINLPYKFPELCIYKLFYLETF